MGGSGGVCGGEKEGDNFKIIFFIYHLFHHFSGSQCCYYCFKYGLLACRLAGTDCKNRQLPKILILE